MTDEKPQMMTALGKNDKLRIKEVDKTVKNRFRLAWLDNVLTISNGTQEDKINVGDSFVKLDIPGIVHCRVCMDNVRYGASGFKAISGHATRAKHIRLHFEKATSLNDHAELPSMSSSGLPNHAIDHVWHENKPPAVIAVLDKTDEHRIKEVDKTVKNRFRFAWLDKVLTISNGKQEDKISAGDSFVKLDTPGIVQCRLCMDNVRYGASGFKAISDHATRAKHIKLHFEKSASSGIPNAIDENKSPLATMAAQNKIDELQNQIKEVDKFVKNRFKFEWFDKVLTISNGKKEVKVRAGDTLVKSDTPGIVQCKLCMDDLKYGSSGFKAISHHVQCAKHIRLHFEKATNRRVDSMFKKIYSGLPKNSPSTSASELPNAVEEDEPAPVAVSMCDRVSNAQATILGINKDDLKASCTEQMDTDMEKEVERAKKRKMTEKLVALSKKRKLNST